MTDAELAEIEATWSKATPGPWEWDEMNEWIHHNEGDDSGHIVVEVKMSEELATHFDLQALLASRAHVDALLAEVKMLRGVT